MKRFVVFALALIFILLLAACGTAGKTSEPSSQGVSAGNGASASEGKAGPDAAGPGPEGQESADRRANALFSELSGVYPGGPSKESYSYFTCYRDGDQVVLEIGVTDDAAIDAYLAAWTGSKWDKLIKVPGRVSQARQEEFAQRAGMLDLGPDVAFHVTARDGPSLKETGRIFISVTAAELEPWEEIPQKILDLAKEMGVPEDMFSYLCNVTSAASDPAADPSAIYRYDNIPDFPLPDIVPQKIRYHNVLIGDMINLSDAELIEQTVELLGRVEFCGPSFQVEEDAEPDRVVSIYRHPEDEEPAYALCFFEDGSMYIRTAEGRSEAYSTLNWVSTEEADGLALRLGRRIRVWTRPNDPDHPLPKGTLYTVKGSPFFHPAFDDVKKIYYHDAALGEDWTVIDPQVIGKIVKKIKNFTFYDEPAPAVPDADSFRYQCFEYFAFYENEEDDTPIFSMGLDPFYVKIGEEKFGPYAVDILDDEITELLKLFL